MSTRDNSAVQNIHFPHDADHPFSDISCNHCACMWTEAIASACRLFNQQCHVSFEWCSAMTLLSVRSNSPTSAMDLLWSGNATDGPAAFGGQVDFESPRGGAPCRLLVLDPVVDCPRHPGSRVPAGHNFVSLLQNQKLKNCVVSRVSLWLWPVDTSRVS